MALLLVGSMTDDTVTDYIASLVEEDKQPNTFSDHKGAVICMRSVADRAGPRGNTKHQS